MSLSFKYTTVFMIKGNQLFLDNHLLSWLACFQTHASASSLKSKTYPTFMERSLLSVYVSSFSTAATFFSVKHPSLTRTSEIIPPGTLSGNNLRNNIPWHIVRAAIREEQEGKEYKRHLSKLSSHNILSEQVTAFHLITPRPNGKKKKNSSTKR